VATTFKLPKRITEGNNIAGDAELRIDEGGGVYVYVHRLDTNESVELIEEGNGEPGRIEHIIKYVRANRRRYVEQRISDALADDWQRGRLGLTD
jgi:hypothetical protein